MQIWQSLAREGALGDATVAPDQSILISSQEAASCCLFLSSGAAEIFHSNAEGQSTVVKIVTAPTMLASPELLVGEEQYLASIRAAGEARVFSIARDRFLNILTRKTGAALETSLDIAIAFAGAAKFESSRLYGTDVLLAAILCAYADVFGQETQTGTLISLRRSQAELAEAIGASERQVNRILLQWKKDGLIDKSKGLHTISNIEGLAKLAGDLRHGLVHRWKEIPELL